MTEQSIIDNMKVGDIVTSEADCLRQKYGNATIIHIKPDNPRNFLTLCWIRFNYHSFDRLISIGHLNLIKSNKLNNNKNFMNNITSLIKKITRREPEKTFVEVGFIDEQDNITEDGKEALQYILWNEKKDELKKLADKLNQKNGEDNK